MARGVFLVLATCLATPGCLAEIPEAVPWTDAGALGYCAGLEPAPRFCADFDDVPEVTSGWTSFDDPPNAVFELDSEIAVSPARSARTELVDGPDCSYAQLRQTIPGSVADFAVGFDVRPETELRDGYYVATLDYRAEDNSCIVLLSLKDEWFNVSLQRYQDSTSDNFGDGFQVLVDSSPQDVWSRFEIRVELSPQDLPRFVVSWNGEQVRDWQPDPESLWLVCHQAPADGSFELRIGSHCMTGSAVNNFDNVTYAAL